MEREDDDSKGGEGGKAKVGICRQMIECKEERKNGQKELGREGRKEGREKRRSRRRRRNSNSRSRTTEEEEDINNGIENRCI